MLLARAGGVGTDAATSEQAFTSNVILLKHTRARMLQPVMG